MQSGLSVAVIGGTGHLGAALSRRWLQAGIDVAIGSRDAGRAKSAAAALATEFGRPVPGDDNRSVAASAQVIVVTVPFKSQREILQSIRAEAQGKIVIDATVPLVPPKVMRVQLPAEGASALIAQEVLGPGVTVVSAFHNVAAHRLAAAAPVDCDVLVFGDSKEARIVAVDLAAAAGLRGIHAGSLANSAAAEALTSVLIFINKTYSVDGAGIRITGLSTSEPA